MNGRVWVVLLITTGLMAVGAQAADYIGPGTDWFDGNNWSGGVVPDANTPANIGTSGTGSVSVTITGTANAGRTQVGLSGGASVTGNVTISAGATLNTWGAFLNTDEGEEHGFDVGGYSAGNLTLEANASLVMQLGDSMGIGKADTWAGGFDTHVIMKPGSSITIGSAGDGWASFGLGDGNSAPNNASQTLEMHNATINGILFHIGGTVIIKGSCHVSKTYRARTYAGAGDTIMKLVGDGPLLSSSGGKFRGLRVDVSEMTKTPYTIWRTVADIGPGTYWPDGDQDIDFIPGTDPNWEMRIVWPMPSGSVRAVEIRYVPEPITLALLALGGLAALRRGRK